MSSILSLRTGPERLIPPISKFSLTERLGKTDEAPNSLIALVSEEDWDGRVMDFGDPITGHLEPSFSC